MVCDSPLFKPGTLHFFVDMNILLTNITEDDIEDLRHCGVKLEQKDDGSFDLWMYQYWGD